ncbi:MAG TPA: hypothetical protein VNZ58_02095 [Thermomicrobiales bacterium]|nr:hypothetical protein [Thermomicrobiales bacterium]
MNPTRWTIRHWILSGILLVALIFVIVGGWTFYDAWDAGVLPWQPDPTRVVVTPFANLPTEVATPGQ